MAAEYEEEEEPKPKPKRARRPVDWALLIMILGTLVFLLVFGAITLMAPRRPFLAVRAAQQGQQVKPAGGVAGTVPTAAATAAPATTPATKP